MNEVYKSLNYMNPAFMKDFFLEKLMPYDLRDSDKLILPKTNSKRYGTSALHFQMCLLWNNLPLKVKRACSYNSFKNEINNIRISCTCLLCKI